MKLIGKYDSPYVRRVAITLNVLGVPFEHEALSVFSAYDAFAVVNPVVKAPTLVTDDGTVLLDSGLIIEYAQRLTGTALAPADINSFVQSQRVIGLALAVCEKSVQIAYENNLRPQDKRHQPWLDRIEQQLTSACRLLEHEAQNATPWFFEDRMMEADISAAVAYDFTRRMLPDHLDPQQHPHLAALSARAEETGEFTACPFR